MSAIDFTLAKSKHMLWKTKLHSFLTGHETMTNDQAVSHTACDLGKWLHFDGMKHHGNIPEMKTLEKKHIELHALVKTIITKKNAGDAKTAEAEFKKLEPISKDIVELLTLIEKKVSHKAA